MTPGEHYDEADRLMVRVAQMDNPTLPIARAMTAQAAVHAALAQVYQPEPMEAPAIAIAQLTGDRL